MKTTTKVLLAIGGIYIAIDGRGRRDLRRTRRDNDEFQPQNEFKLDTWINLPGRSTSTRP